MNTLVPGRTDAEYREQNREQIRAKNTETYQANIEQSRKYFNDYYHSHKDAIRTSQLNYRMKHIDEIREAAKRNRELNRDKLREYFRLKQQEYGAKCKDKPIQRINCEICGGLFRTGGRLRHERSLMHQAACENTK